MFSYIVRKVKQTNHLLRQKKINFLFDNGVVYKIEKDIEIV